MVRRAITLTTPEATSSAKTPKATRSASAARNDVTSISRFPEGVTRSADGLQKSQAAVFLQLLAQIGDVRLDHVGLRIERHVPHLLQQLDACDHVVGMQHEVLQQSELSG